MSDTSRRANVLGVFLHSIFSNYFARVALLAAMYALAGGLGLMLAVPPGYATIVWPASGIAIGMLLLHGARLWPGVLIGSFLVNAFHSAAFADPRWDDPKLLAAAAIAIGSTIQSLVARALIARFIGVPLRFQSPGQVLLTLALAGPVSCLIAATSGVGVLLLLHLVPSTEAPANWFAWWCGDTLGVALFMPLVLLASGERRRLTWRAEAVGRLPLAGMLLLLLPLGLTFYAWKSTTENEYQRSQTKFELLTTESEKAIQNRLGSYGNALLGATGFVQGSTQITRQDWRTYVETIRSKEYFPGLNGVGWVRVVEADAIAEFVAGMRRGGTADFAVHPQPVTQTAYVISLVEPDEENHAALGLNIAFEHNRREAAELARDTGTGAITRHIVLNQDAQRMPGFLVLYPIYDLSMPMNTIADRRAALRGWTYAVFFANKLLGGLEEEESSAYRLSVYDDDKPSTDALIFRNDALTAARSEFHREVKLRVMQREWLLVWDSSTAFEGAERSSNPRYILFGGLLFTALLTLLLIVIAVRRAEHIEQMVGERRFALPLLVFLVVAGASVLLNTQLRRRESDFLRRQVVREAGQLESELRATHEARIAAISRMALRWNVAGGTAFGLWRADVESHIRQTQSLRAVQWIDPDYRVRWSEPLTTEFGTSALDIQLPADRIVALRSAAAYNAPLVTAPLRLAENRAAVIAYLPLKKRDRFDGFLAAVFDVEDSFRTAIATETARKFDLELLYEGRTYLALSHDNRPLAPEWTIERFVRIGTQAWTLRIAPAAAFIATEQSQLPPLVLAAGLLVAALSGLSVRYILISRLKSAHLAKSLALNAGIISSSAHLVIAIDERYRIMIFNRAAVQALGYAASEVVGHRAIPIFLDPLELDARAQSLSEELGENIAPGPEIFTRLPLRDGFETREWTFIRKDRTRFPASVTITPLRDARGVSTGFLGVIEDASVRKEMDRMKTEFTAVVSHELRTPLTSIRGSLGLILGAMTASLPEKVKSLLMIAQSNCERLMLLVNDILDIEKFSAGHMRFHAQKVSLARVALQAVEANEGYARRYNVRIALAPIDPGIEVAVDPDRFIQVMSNLLSNAAKYSSAGGTVRVDAEASGTHVRVSVSDDGPGIPENFRERIFEKFSQADASATREKGGTGLGLHIARRFVEHMQGRIGFNSQAGKGATFWVELPIAASNVATETAA